MSRAVRVIVVGGTGRMGLAVLEAAGEDPGIEMIGAVARTAPSVQLPGAVSYTADLGEALARAPGAVVVDVSSPVGAADRIRRISDGGHPLVEGTTGLDSAATKALEAAAGEVAVVVAPNTSPGLALLEAGLRRILESKQPSWPVAIVDRHHLGKKDAPSGTAKRLRAVVEEARAEPPPDVASFRQGGVVGEHTVYLTGEDEEVVLIHRAFRRRAFARGALLAATFAASAPPGRYTMQDVLDL